MPACQYQCKHSQYSQRRAVAACHPGRQPARCQSEVKKRKVTQFSFLRVCKQHHEGGQSEVFKISGPATQVRIAAAEARGTLMMVRKVAAGSLPCWQTPIAVGKGLAPVCRFRGRDGGSGWEWHTLHTSAPGHPVTAAATAGFLLSGTSAAWVTALAAKAKGNVYLDRWPLQSAGVWPRRSGE